MQVMPEALRTAGYQSRDQSSRLPSDQAAKALQEIPQVNGARSRRSSPSPLGHGVGMSNAAGACLACRKSKVKCDNNGEAPCKRCRKGNYECVFRAKEVSIQAEEEWRAKTDANLSLLANAIGSLVRSGGAGAGAGAGGDSYNLISPPLPHPPPPAAARKRQRLDNDGTDSIYFDQSLGAQSVPPPPTLLSTPSDHLYRAAPHSDVSSHSFVQQHQSVPAHVPAPDHNEPGVSTSAHDHSLQLQLAFPLLPNTAAEEGIGHAQATQYSTLPVPKSLSGFSTVSLGRSTSRLSLPDRVSAYLRPAHNLAMDDPRQDVIRLAIIDTQQARTLVSFFARLCEPLGFCFPSFPASSDLTPVLLSALTATASPFSRTHSLCSRYGSLRKDIIKRTSDYIPNSFDDEFDPETGIGAEEIIGAAIFSTFDGSAESLRIARAARWWSENCSYERAPCNGQTVGEMFSMLPPLRHVDVVNRVRVWLSAYIAEAHLCIIHDCDPIASLIDPEQYGRIILFEEEHSDSIRAGAARQDVALLFYAKVAHLLLVDRKRKRRHADVLEELSATFYRAKSMIGDISTSPTLFSTMLSLYFLLSDAFLRTRNAIRQGMRPSAVNEARLHCIECLSFVLKNTSRLKESQLVMLPAVYHHYFTTILHFSLSLLLEPGNHLELLPSQGAEVFSTCQSFMALYSPSFLSMTMDGAACPHPARESVRFILQLMKEVEALDVVAGM